MNITDPIWHHAQACPDRAAVFYEGHVLSFAALCRDTERAAFNLAQAGIASGQRVAVALPITSPVLHFVVVLALARMGATSVAAAFTLPPEAQSELARRCGVTAFVRGGAKWKIGGIPDDAHILADGLVRGGDAPRNAAPVPADCADRPWRISLSSGTTGVPKGIAWTHAQGSRLMDQLQAAIPSGPSERLLMFLDPSLMYSMNQMLRQLCAGGALVFPRTLIPAEFFICVKRDRVTQAMTSNAQAWNALQYAKQADSVVTEASRRLRHFSVSGSAMSRTLQSELRERICANFHIVYGSTEAGMLARADPDSLDQFPGSAGYLVPLAEAETVDDAGRVLPRGTPGNLRFRTPAMASGYEGDAEATAKAFRDGWFYPGDTGSVDSRGMLTLGARADDIINIAGVKIDPTVIEAVLNEDPSVRDSVVVAAVTERGAAVLVAVVVALQPIDAEALRAKCRERLGQGLTPARILTVERLPRSPEGKLLRRETAAMVRAQSAPPKEAGDASRTH